MSVASLGIALYALCVDFMLVTARALSLTYRDTNVLGLLVLMPLSTAALGLWVLALRRRRAHLRALTERSARRCTDGTARRADRPPGGC